MKIFFWIFIFSTAISFYTYVGYGLLMLFISKLKSQKENPQPQLHSISIIIPSYNEFSILNEKINNTIIASSRLKDIEIIVITDGSTDESKNLLNHFDFSIQIIHLHSDERKGKSNAINRAMTIAKKEIIVLTDANAYMNEDAILLLQNAFHNEKIGAVSGEKKVKQHNSTVGNESIYWQYESKLKKWSAQVYSLTGAAGELIAFRKNLFTPIPNDAILDDLHLSLSIVKQGKIIGYEPRAFVLENPSKNIKDEMNRKVRISSGIFQTLSRNLFVFNPFKNFFFHFQFISHRFFRWTIAPISLLLLYISNLFLLHEGILFVITFILQSLFYILGSIGFVLRNNKSQLFIFSIPFYFTMMNVALFWGYLKYFTGNSSVLWDKAER